MFFAMLFVLIFAPLDGVQVTFTTMLLILFGGWVGAKDALKAIDFNLLALIGAALGFAVSVETSGLAGYSADFVKNQGLPPIGALFLVAILTLILTNIVTNNAAAVSVFVFIPYLALTG